MSLRMELVGRFFEPRRSSFFLFGPRGTGKTVLTMAAFPDALRIDLLDPETYRLYAARPGGLRTGGIHCVPVDDFLKKLHPGAPLFQ